MQPWSRPVREAQRPAALLLAALTLAPAAGSPAGFYARSAEGWFWYRDSRVPIVPVPAPVAPPPVAPAPPPESLAEPPAPPGPAPLSAQWFRENLDSYRDRAIDAPSPENVAVYLHLQRIAMDKSSRFATVSERVVQGDPLLDEVTRRPTATFGANLVDRQASAAADALLGRLAETAALWFLFRSDCPYCDAQAPLLEALAARYGFAVLAVSLDGAGLKDGRFPDYRVDRGQAQVLGVLSTPALFLARPDQGEVAPLAQGLLSLSQLRERIVLAAVQAGWITEPEAQHVKATVTQTHLAPAALAVLPEDPASLLESLRRLPLQDSSMEAPQ